MSSNFVGFNDLGAVPVQTLVYHDMAGRKSAQKPDGRGDEGADDAGGARRAEVQLSQEEFVRRIEQEKTDAVREAEERLRAEYERKLTAERAPVATAITAFGEQRDQYFEHAEAEIVQLALAIAAKILHREAQVDPMLVATLVRMAVEKMREGSSVTVRVERGQAARWKQSLEGHAKNVKLELVEDSGLSDHDCVVETELGAANFGLDTQLKEVERGFFDLMALRPAKG